MDQSITTDMQRASRLLKLLGDQTRLTMMKLLQSHDYCVCEFTAMFNMSQPAISQHLRKLRDIELVKETRKGKWIFYSINREHEDYLFVQNVLTSLPGQDALVTTLEAQGLRICCE
ncbi:ArsR/SmtB family transcription factor [Sporosarcina sp. NPDC096371]|uniref:ArsR/SmtB family transcription factor n=1 Tax=Sporosarcina sp. NPDC096371 TaxID=3364530 RepID=UPI00381935A5